MGTDQISFLGVTYSCCFQLADMFVTSTCMAAASGDQAAHYYYYMCLSSSTHLSDDALIMVYDLVLPRLKKQA